MVWGTVVVGAVIGRIVTARSRRERADQRRRDEARWVLLRDRERFRGRPQPAGWDELPGDGYGMTEDEYQRALTAHRRELDAGTPYWKRYQAENLERFDPR